MVDKLTKPQKFDDREPDPEPKADDLPAYLHVDTKVQPEQDKRSFPLQLLRHSKGRKQKPTDVAESWDDAAIEEPPAGYDCWVDVYEGPRGIGYTVGYELDKGGVLYQRYINFGPEKERDQDWSEVVAPKEPEKESK